jgi:hypothetical protein
MNQAVSRYWSRDQWWCMWGGGRVHHTIWHWRRRVWFTGKKSSFSSRNTWTCTYELKVFQCQLNRVVQIWWLYTIHFQISNIQVDPPQYNSSNVTDLLSSTNHLCLTVHNLPRHCHNPSLVETKVLHNPSPVQIRGCPNTKRLLLREQHSSCMQL